MLTRMHVFMYIYFKILKVFQVEYITYICIWYDSRIFTLFDHDLSNSLFIDKNSLQLCVVIYSRHT